MTMRKKCPCCLALEPALFPGSTVSMCEGQDMAWLRTATTSLWSSSPSEGLCLAAFCACQVFVIHFSFLWLLSACSLTSDVAASLFVPVVIAEGQCRWCSKQQVLKPNACMQTRKRPEWWRPDHAIIMLHFVVRN